MVAMRLLWVSVLAIAAFAQDAPPVSLNDAEKKFQQDMTNVTMKGFFTVGDDPATQEDTYRIERVTKVKDDVWNFEARVMYNGKDFKATIPVPVKWAGETPVLTLTNYFIKGHGIFSARILVFQGMYAGTWGAQSHGGKMFGKIIKND